MKADNANINIIENVKKEPGSIGTALYYTVCLKLSRIVGVSLLLLYVLYIQIRLNWQSCVVV